MPGENMLVFRDDAEQIPGPVLANHLAQAVERGKANEPSSIMDSLLLAGQIECALLDLGHRSADQAVRLTDGLAGLLAEPDRVFHTDVLSSCRALGETLPEMVRISHPEGFSYYGLHARDFIDAFVDQRASGSFAVIGIRSIGTTLSAVAAAALRAKGISPSRTTVRPTGHPYNRSTQLSAPQRSWVEDENRRGSRFIIVDEGPGLSGSSFLSVGECLMDLGVSSERILLLGTHDINPDQLCAPDAARRWRRFTWRSVQSCIYQRFHNMEPLSGGQWRSVFLPRNAAWPPSWREMESLKFWSDGHRAIFKFDGLGEFGKRVRERSSAIHQAGFSPEVQHAGDGMSSYRYIAGPPLSSRELSREVLDRMAEYCAFRASEFPVSKQVDDQLQQMVRHNFQEETGQCLDLPDDALCTTSPVVADARMQPHEWIRAADGTLLKVDAARHGDDHFLPGPTEITWDIAGAIVEWNMDAAGAEYLISAFRRRSRLDPSSKLGSFILAYSAFRMGYCKMALSGTQDPQERLRFRNAYLQYREKMLLTARTIAPVS